jgi:CheY-like chemotaxis protein
MLHSPTITCSREAPPPRIVVADDDAELRELIAIMLRRRGFEVVLASDGAAALAVILSDGADGLVSDLQMPGLDGLTLCRVLRGLGAGVGAPGMSAATIWPAFTFPGVAANVTTLVTS